MQSEYSARLDQQRREHEAETRSRLQLVAAKTAENETTQEDLTRQMKTAENSLERMQRSNDEDQTKMLRRNQAKIDLRVDVEIRDG